MVQQERFLAWYEKYMLFIGAVGHSIFIFQAYKILQTHSAANISLSGFCISVISIASWLVYGIYKKDNLLIFVNMFGFVCGIMCLFLIFLYK